MRCPFCGFNESKVGDSRPTEDGRMIRRRRECLSCGKRFTTFEKVDETLFVASLWFTEDQFPVMALSAAETTSPAV